MTGQGKAIICAVGDNTLLHRVMGKGNLDYDENITHLEEKLKITAKQIEKFAMLVMAITIITHLIFLVIYIPSTDQTLFGDKTLLKCAQIGIIAIVILIVAIPEGLPLSISLAMSFSINRLKKEQILIKKMQSIQYMAMCHEINVGKTGCLTKSRMTVGKYQITKDSNLNDHVADDSNNRDAFTAKLEIMNEIKDVICESIISNSDVYLIAEEEGHNFCYEPKG